MFLCDVTKSSDYHIFARRYLNLLFKFLYGGANSTVHHSSSLRHFLWSSTKAAIDHISAKLYEISRPPYFYLTLQTLPSIIFLCRATKSAGYYICVWGYEICQSSFLRLSTKVAVHYKFACATNCAVHPNNARPGHDVKLHPCALRTRQFSLFLRGYAQHHILCGAIKSLFQFSRIVWSTQSEVVPVLAIISE